MMNLTMFMVSVISSCDMIEKSRTISRMKSGRDNYISKGGKLGRRLNSVVSIEDKLKQHSDIVKLLKSNTYSLRQIGKLTDKSLSTIQRVKKLI